MITENYVSFKTAKLLKEKGFDEYCPLWYNLDKPIEGPFFYKEIGWYGHNSYDYNGKRIVSAPSQSMAMKWLREVHNIDIVIDAAVGMLGVKVYVPLISIYKPLKDAPSKVRQIKRGIYYKDDKGVIPALQHFDSYEKAVKSALKYCLENLI